MTATTDADNLHSLSDADLSTRIAILKVRALGPRDTGHTTLQLAEDERRRRYANRDAKNANGGAS